MESKINHLLQEARAAFYNAKKIKIVITMSEEDIINIQPEFRKWAEGKFMIGDMPEGVIFKNISTPWGDVEFKTDGE